MQTSIRASGVIGELAILVSIFTDYKLTAEYNYTIRRPKYIITQYEVPTAYVRLRR